MKILTKKDLIKIHDELIKVSGEEFDILSGSKLDEIARKHEKFKTLTMKAAVLLHKISRFQAFSEGNKRTAFSSFKIFISINKKRLKASNRELEDIILKSVNNNMSLRDVEKWLKKKIV